MYEFTKEWFDFSEIKYELEKHINPNAVNKFLEIGAYEGSSTCYFSDNFLDVNGSTLVCVDPFDVTDSTSPVYSNIFQVFKNNVYKSKNWQKIRLRQLYSNDFFKQNKDTFTFIYIDGSHLPEDVKSDFNYAIQFIQLNGIIWMDDYASSDTLTKLIDALYEANKDTLTVIHSGYQIAFRKTK